MADDPLDELNPVQQNEGDAAPEGSQPPAEASSEEYEQMAAMAVTRSKQALRLASASLPHLSGLARLARIKATNQVSVAAVSASGLVLVNPEIFSAVSLADGAYVLAHELMHLALDTHGREGRANKLLANFAHDYIINDILTEELEREPPLDGLNLQGAKEISFEEMMVKLSEGGSGDTNSMQCWSPNQNQQGQFPGRKQRQSPSPMSRALADAGLVKPPEPPPPMDESLMRGDLISPERESDFEPELSPQQRQTMNNKVRRAAAKAASLQKLKKQMEEAGQGAQVTEPERGDAIVDALRAAYHTPWELALQRWMDAVAPGERTYARPSRRGAERTDVVLPGRRREGWTLHVILDVSGSLQEYLPKALGALAQFCEASNVGEVHVVQCDVEVTRDEWVEIGDLERYEIKGLGYSDMTPAMVHLAEDSEVTAVLMLTDGYIGYWAQEPPYQMLWVLLGEYDQNFKPPYGQVLRLGQF